MKVEVTGKFEHYAKGKIIDVTRSCYLENKKVLTPCTDNMLPAPTESEETEDPPVTEN